MGDPPVAPTSALAKPPFMAHSNDNKLESLPFSAPSVPLWSTFLGCRHGRAFDIYASFAFYACVPSLFNV